MFSINKLKKKNFAVYGLGATGKSIISYFKKRGFSNYCTYDDYKKSNKKNIFIKYLKTADFIILSPGINIIKSKLKKNLLENKQKIISDLDLFYMTNSKIKTINTKYVDKAKEFAHCFYFFKREYFKKNGWYWNWNKLKYITMAKTMETFDIDT